MTTDLPILFPALFILAVLVLMLLFGAHVLRTVESSSKCAPLAVGHPLSPLTSTEYLLPDETSILTSSLFTLRHSHWVWVIVTPSAAHLHGGVKGPQGLKAPLTHPITFLCGWFRIWGVHGLCYVRKWRSGG